MIALNLTVDEAIELHTLLQRATRSQRAAEAIFRGPVAMDDLTDALTKLDCSLLAALERRPDIRSAAAHHLRAMGERAACRG